MLVDYALSGSYYAQMHTKYFFTKSYCTEGYKCVNALNVHMVERERDARETSLGKI